MKFVTLFTSITTLFLFVAYGGKAQYIEIEGPDTIHLCAPGPVTLSAQFFGVDSLELQSSSSMANQDDVHGPVVDLDFAFTFYGNTYTQCVLSTNGYITFNTALANTYSPWNITNPIPTGTPTQILNSIMGPWQDLRPGLNPTPGWLTYTTFGDAPNRIFIYNLCLVPYFGSQCGGNYFTGQIKLFETSNNIEFHIGRKDLCTAWNAGEAILGIQNATGTLATVVNNLNANVQWTMYNKAFRLSPTSPTTYQVDSIPYNPVEVYGANQLQWTYLGNNITGSDSATVNVTQSGWVKVAFSGCFGNVVTTPGADSVYIALSSINTTQSQVTSACNDSSDNELTIQFPGNLNAPYSLTWSDAAGNTIETQTGVFYGATLDTIPAGDYQVLVTNAIGCTFNYNYSIPVYTMEASFTSDPPLVCQNAPITFTNTSTGSITGYRWIFPEGEAYQANFVNAFGTAADSQMVTMTIVNDTFPNCTFTDTAFYNVHPNIVAGFLVDSPRCAGDIVFLNDYSAPYPVSWQWFVDDSLISTDRNTHFVRYYGGAYSIKLIVADSLCGVDTASSTTFIHDFPQVFIGIDTLLCPGEEITLNAGNPGMTYSWSTGQQTQEITLNPTETMIVSVIVNNNGCKRSDERLITMNCSIIFPNVFSPNGDGTNDYFLPHLVNVESYDMLIYNRWGQLMYSLKGGKGSYEKEGWDGRWRKENQPIGAYVYYAKGIDIRGKPVEVSGTFLLIR